MPTIPIDYSIFSQPSDFGRMASARLRPIDNPSPPTTEENLPMPTLPYGFQVDGPNNITKLRSLEERGHMFSYNERAPQWTGKWFLKNERPLPHSRLFGVELETINRNAATTTNTAITSQIYKSLAGFVICKADGSLGSAGIEIVSAPATLGVHRLAWTKFFFGSDDPKLWGAYMYAEKKPDLLGPAKELISYKSNVCGMHVHVSSRGIPSVLHLSRLHSFINNFQQDKYLSRIAGRSIGKHGAGNSYAELRDPKLLKNINNEGRFSPGRYSALNLSPPETVEFRIFRGNTNPIGFMKNLDFCDSVIEFSGAFNASDITGANYIEWVSSSKINHMYPFINAWLKKHKVHLLREAAAPANLRLFPNATILKPLKARPSKKTENIPFNAAELE